MPTLAGFNGKSLSTHLGNAVGQGFAIRGERQRQDLLGQQFELEQAKHDAELLKQQQLQQLLGQIGTPQTGAPQLGTQNIPAATPPISGAGTQPKRDASLSAMAKLAIQFPEKFEQVNKNLGLISQQQKDEAADFAFQLQNVPVDSRQAAIQNRADILTSQRRDPSDTLELLTMDEDQQNEALNIAQVAALSTEKRLELAKGGDPFSLSPGQVQFDRDGNVIASVDPASKLLSPAEEAQKARIARAGSAKTTIDLSNKAEGKEREEIAKVRAKQFSRLIEEGEKSELMLESLNQLDAIDVDTGALEPAKAAFAAIAEGFGIDASGIANIDTAQSFKAASNRLVNNVLNQAKGPQTEGDAQRARSTIANLGDAPLAAQFKSDSLRAVALRTIEQRDFVESLVDDGETFSAARKKWNAHKKITPSLSALVKNPSTGLPLYFYQFKDLAAQRRPGISNAEVIEAWRSANAK